MRPSFCKMLNWIFVLCYFQQIICTPWMTNDRWLTVCTQIFGERKGFNWHTSTQSHPARSLIFCFPNQNTYSLLLAGLYAELRARSHVHSSTRHGPHLETHILNFAQSTVSRKHVCFDKSPSKMHGWFLREPNAPKKRASLQNMIFSLSAELRIIK